MAGRTHPDNLVNRFRRYLRKASFAASVFSIYTAVMYVVTSGRNVARYGLTLVQMVFLNFALAVYVAAIVAVLAPWATSRFKAGMVGLAAGWPITVLSFLVLAPGLGAAKVLVGSLVLAAFLGWIYGTYAWDHERSQWEDEYLR
jgi:hypothetical protein